VGLMRRSDSNATERAAAIQWLFSQ